MAQMVIQIKSNLAALSTLALVHLLMGRLGHYYSLSGVSLGRSHRSRLLEAAQELIWDKDFTECDVVYPEEELLEEAKRRLKNRRPSGNEQLLLFGDPPFASNATLIKTLLAALWSWYREDAKRFDCLPQWERNLALYAYELFESDEKELDHESDLKRIILEADDRRRFTHCPELENDRSFALLWQKEA